MHGVPTGPSHPPPQVVLTRLESKGGLGGSSAAITARRTETVLFLDDKLRVVKVADVSDAECGSVNMTHGGTAVVGCV